MFPCWDGGDVVIKQTFLALADVAHIFPIHLYTK